MIVVVARYPRWLSPVLSSACARARWLSLITLIVIPLRGHISFGMNAQRRRSSDASGKVATVRWLSESDVRNRLAASAIDSAGLRYARAAAVRPTARVSTARIGRARMVLAYPSLVQRASTGRVILMLLA